MDILYKQTWSLLEIQTPFKLSSTWFSYHQGYLQRIISSLGLRYDFLLSDLEQTWSHEISRRTWWHHQMEMFSALLALCARNSPANGEFPAQRPVTQSFDVCFDLRLNKPLSKHSWGWWFETPSRSLWRHCNGDPKCYLLVRDPLTLKTPEVGTQRLPLLTWGGACRHPHRIWGTGECPALYTLVHSWKS